MGAQMRWHFDHIPISGDWVDPVTRPNTAHNYFTQRGNKAKNRGLHDPMPL
jgi:hypothetical protein